MKKAKMNKKLILLSVILIALFLIIIINYWPAKKPHTSVTRGNLPTTKEIKREEPQKVVVPEVSLNSNKNVDNLTKFKNYLQRIIESDKNLTTSERTSYIGYIKKLEQFIDFQKNMTEEVEEVQQLSHEYFIKRLKNQVAQEDETFSKLQLEIKRNNAQMFDNQLFEIPQAIPIVSSSSLDEDTQSFNMEKDMRVNMIYGDFEKLRAFITINGVGYYGVEENEIIGRTHRVEEITPNRVTLSDKNEKKYILNLLED